MNALKLNLAANYISLGYSTAISLIFMPPLHSKLGGEYFGLIGIFVILSNVISILDLGLVSTISRECAIKRNDSKEAGNLPIIISTAGKLMLGAATLILLIFALTPADMANKWINLNQIDARTATICLNLIAASVVVRWLAGLHRGVLNGFEKQLATSGINALTSTLRFPAAYLLINLSSSPGIFYFQLQLAIAIMEYALVYTISKRVSAGVKKNNLKSQAKRQLLRRTYKFSIGVAILTTITTIFTQADKIILSKFLPLTDFGNFSLIASLATGLALLSSPISTALIPRLSSLMATKKQDELYESYKTSIRLILILIAPAGLALTFFSKQALFVWTGQAYFATLMSETFSIYVLGNFLWILAALPGYLKYAQGEIRFMISYNLIFLVAYLPTAIFVGHAHGAIGLALSWLIVNALMLTTAHQMIHRKIFTRQQANNMLKECGFSIILIVLFYSITTSLVEWSTSRPALFLQLCATTIAAGIITYFQIYRK